ncbi:hypothetical protein J3R83DRAFT_9158 [Lanmaoa asiatica]|nr:hypothetical protein J3R83DRAFT_9158 [Lanmaoa asiatica]
MVSLPSGFIAALMTLSVFGLVLAVPLVDKLKSLSVGARDILKRTTPAAPHFIAYNDAWSYPFPSASQLQGYNVYALAFWVTSGAADMALGWQELTDSERTSYLQEYNAAGISLIVSAFGSTDAPTSSGTNAATVASNLASWVLEYGLQGDLNAFSHGGGSAETWLISFTQQIRAHLPEGEYILSHAPVAPWFSPTLWTGGGYLAVHRSVGSLIDWVTYNFLLVTEGTSEYTTCSGLITASSSSWPQTALFQIAANGVSLDKLVIGKPGTTGDANNGYMSTSTLASCVAQAHSSGWSKWPPICYHTEYPHVGSSWITAVRGNTWPVSGSPPPVTPLPTPATTTVPAPHPTTSSPTPTTTAPSGSGNCAGVSAWVNNVAVSTIQPHVKSCRSHSSHPSISMSAGAESLTSGFFQRFFFSLYAGPVLNPLQAAISGLRTSGTRTKCQEVFRVLGTTTARVLRSRSFSAGRGE